MVLLARDISKQIEQELEYPGQTKVNVIRESRVTDYVNNKKRFREESFLLLLRILSYVHLFSYSA